MPTDAPVAVVVDSAASLPPQMAQEAGLRVVPIELIFGRATYRDGELPPEQFYRMLKGAREPPTTSAPSPSNFLEAFQQVGPGARGILCLTLVSRLSASYDHARLAAQIARQLLPDTPILVLDSQNAGGALGFIALEAARSARRGASLEDAARRAQALIPRVRLMAFLDTLSYVRRSGRVSSLGFWASEILGIKPLLALSQGEVHSVALTRTRRRATRKLLALLEEASARAKGPLHVNVLHTNALDEAEELQTQIAQRVLCAELFVSEMTTAMAVHAGPGLLGLAFYADEAPG